MRTILVTGGAGFIGSNYLNRFVRQYPNYFFINVDALTYAGSLDNIDVAEKPNYVFEHVNICNTTSLSKVFDRYTPTDIIHFAAESHVDNSIKSPGIFIETNIVGTENLLELARVHTIQRFHFISTDEVYGSLSLDDTPVTESAPLLPRSPYSASKAGAELLVRAYHETFGLNTVITRASNNYGPHQHREKFIPVFITQLSSGKKATALWPSGENVRDWNLC